jgi:hypothetical protein
MNPVIKNYHVAMIVNIYISKFSSSFTKSCLNIGIGICGEPCPRQCRICNKHIVQEIFFGSEDEPDARFVFLPDCRHLGMFFKTYSTFFCKLLFLN